MTDWPGQEEVQWPGQEEDRPRARSNRMTGTILDPMLWDSVRRAGEGAVDMARQVPSLDLPRVARDAAREAGEDWRQFSADPAGNTARFLAGIPQAIAQPFADLVTAVPEQRRALEAGDAEAAQRAVDRGVGAVPQVALTAATPALGNSVRAATATAAASTLPLSLARGEGSLQERLPRALVDSAEAAAITAPVTAGFRALPVGSRRAPSPGPSPQLPSGVSERVMEDALRTAQRNRNLHVRNFDDLSQHLEAQATQHPNRVVAEALGEPGVARGMALTRLPGQTGQLAEDVLGPRAESQLSRLESNLQSPVSGDALEQAVREAWRTRGAALYEPIMAAPITGDQIAALNQLQRSPLWNHRAVQAAWQRAEGMVQDDVALGRLPANIADSIKARLHYTKVALSDMVANPHLLEPGLANIDNANLTAAAHQFADALEPIMPNYTAARAELADLGSARRALESGRNFANRREFRSPEALRRYVQGLQGDSRRYFAVGLEDALQDMMTRAARDGRSNIAGRLQNENVLQRIDAAFGPERGRAVREYLRSESRDFITGTRLRAAHNSPTAQMSAEMRELGENLPTTRSGVIDRLLIDPIRRNTEHRWREGYRDALGRYYMTPLSQAGGEGRSLAAQAAREAEAARLERLTSRRRRRGLFGNATLAPAIAEERSRAR